MQKPIEEWLFPSWKRLGQKYNKTYTCKTLHFYSTSEAAKIYWMLVDAGYRCAVDLNINTQSIVWVWVRIYNIK